MNLTKPSTATAFPLRLRLHYKAARVSGVMCPPSIEVFMTEEYANNIALVRNYLLALENGVVGEDLSLFFTDNAIQVEYPNRLNPNGQKSDLASIISRSIQGKDILSSQNYEILTEIAQGNRIAVEANWVGVLSVSIGELAAGTEMKAHFAMFFEFRNGLICKQSNYDCFEPW